jgi:hypothetical protein
MVTRSRPPECALVAPARVKPADSNIRVVPTYPEITSTFSPGSTRALDGAGDEEGASSVDVQLEALVGLLTDALAGDGVG